MLWYIEVDTENVLGTHKLNLTKNVRKYNVKTKGNFQRRYVTVEVLYKEVSKGLRFR